MTRPDHAGAERIRCLSRSVSTRLFPPLRPVRRAGSAASIVAAMKVINYDEYEKKCTPRGTVLLAVFWG